MKIHPNEDDLEFFGIMLIVLLVAAMAATNPCGWGNF
jgi:hypothetical protein